MTPALSADRSAADQALRSVDALLRTIATRYAQPGVEADDLWQEARIAVVQALPKFDCARAKFATFAGFIGKCAMRRYLRKRAYTIRKPEWRWQLGDWEELCPQTDNGEDLDADAFDPRGSIDAKIYVERLLAKLPSREAFVIRQHMDGYTDVDIAAMLFLTRARVQKIRTDACLRLERLLDSDA